MMSAEDNSDSESDEDYIPPNEEHEYDDVQEANSSSSDSETESNEDNHEKLKKPKRSEKNNHEDPSASSELPKKSVDEMWNEFLRDTNSNPIPNGSVNETKTAIPVNVNVSNEVQQASVAEPSNKVVVTEVFDFAGEEIKITKEVDANSGVSIKLEGNQSKSFTSTKSPVQSSSSSLKRPGGGLSSVLNQIGKKQKMGTLEKSKFDWDNFKKTEKLDEELSQHNRGREGFLDKQDFLQRSDYRQFELERDLRLSKRKNV